MDALVIAGGTPTAEDPLFELSGGRQKALIEVAGKSLVQWVLDAISAAQHVDQVVVIGLDEDVQLNCDKPLAYASDQGTMLQNIRTGTGKILELNSEATYVLSVSADIPAITGEMVDWAVETALETEHDIYYNVVRREVMEARFPGSKRSYVRLRDMEVCGGDMNIFRAELVRTRAELWDRLVAARKSVFKQAALIGYGTLLLMLLGRLTIESAAERAGKSMGLRGRGIVCPYAEVAMDVDKPYQLDIIGLDLAKRVGRVT